MSSPTLPLDRIVNVQVFVSPQLPVAPTFNQGLIVGSSAIIPAAERTREYANVAEMLSDGFSLSSPEVLAAELYFGQSPAPQILWIGRQDLTSIATAQVHAANQGTGYAIGDTLTVVQGGASGGKFKVTTTGGSGAVTGIASITNGAGNTGTGYSVANGLVTTTTGAGTGAEIDILTIGDSPLQSLQACRLSSTSWWACMVISAVKADHELIAAFVETMSPVGYYMFTTADADVPLGTAGNIFAFLEALGYSRTLGIYSTTQSGTFPNNAYAAAAVMGTAMGLNTGLANSYFTLKFKQLVGVAVEPLTFNTVNIIENNSGDLYVNYVNAFNILEQGTSVNGRFFDEVLNIDMLSSDIQFSLMDLLVSVPSVPQTDPGESQLIHEVNQACERARVRGFIAGGVWSGPIVLNLVPGKTVPNGYLSQARPYSTQSQADRQARKAMPIYTAIIEAGAVHSVVVGVYVQR